MTPSRNFTAPGRLLAASLLAATLALAGCNDAPGPSGAAAAAPMPVSMAAVGAEAKGFVVGAPMSARTVYVFFDAQCPHCGALWEAAKPLKSQAKFIWIPVGILNASSTSQGATLLAAADPAAAMDQHESSMAARSGGIRGASDIDAQKEQVAANTRLLTRLGFTSIPTVIATHAVTGELVTREGAMPTAVLASFLGLQVPAP